jgi:hypothetical protein
MKNLHFSTLSADTKAQDNQRRRRTKVRTYKEPVARRPVYDRYRDA